MNLFGLWHAPAFRVGLALRLALILLAVPQVQTEWFLPFLRAFLHHPTLDPWSAFLADQGDPLSFPYGPVMLLAYLPGVGIAWGLEQVWGVAGWDHIGFGLTNLAVDLSLMVILRDHLQQSDRQILRYYWLSPIVLYIGYWYGQTDLMPVFFLIASLYALKKVHPRWTGVLLGLAVAAKLSMLMAVPFLLIYFILNKRMQPHLPGFVLALAATLLLVQAPFLWTEGMETMILGNREVKKLFHLVIPLSETMSIYVVPVVYLMVLYSVWRLDRISMDMLWHCIGIGFFILLLLTPSSVGWYLWVLPFLVSHQGIGGKQGSILVVAFTLLFCGMALQQSSGAVIPWLDLDWRHHAQFISLSLSSHLCSLWQSGLAAVGMVLFWRIYSHGISRNEFFRLSRKPILVGIAGDSGSGKDILGLALAGLFEERSVAHISGDDYHLWDRYSPMWQVLTHLDPRANNLAGFYHDVIELANGRAIIGRKYDHHRGLFTRERVITKNEVILISGLHALYLPDLAKRCDVRIFLDMEEGLRRFFKVRRDCQQRGHEPASVLAAMERRLADGETYVRPQAAQADIVFRLQAVNETRLALEAGLGTPALKLGILIRQSTYAKNLVRVLIGICGMRIDADGFGADGSIKLEVEGDVSAEDIRLAASLLVPNLEEVLALEPQWQHNMTGIMQLVVLLQISMVLYGRK